MKRKPKPWLAWEPLAPEDEDDIAADVAALCESIKAGKMLQVDDLGIGKMSFDVESGKAKEGSGDR